jgi:hypothetical protein
MYNKTITKFGFGICEITKVLVSVISLAFGSYDTTYLELGNFAYQKNLVQ